MTARAAWSRARRGGAVMLDMVEGRSKKTLKRSRQHAPGRRVVFGESGPARRAMVRTCLGRCCGLAGAGPDRQAPSCWAGPARGRTFPARAGV